MPRVWSVEGVAKRLHNRCPDPACGGLLYESDDGELGCMRCEQIVYTPQRGRVAPPPRPPKPPTAALGRFGWYQHAAETVAMVTVTTSPTTPACPRCREPLAGSRLACYACGWQRPLDLPRPA